MESWIEPVLDAAEMREIDAWAIEERGVPSLDLMETAGAALAAAAEKASGGGPIRIVCGKGNNGGDGLVAARLLRDWGHDAEALLLWPAAELSGDAAANLGRLDGVAREVAPEALPVALEGSGSVIDAIFGTGFDGVPRDPAAAAIGAVNGCGAPVVAADIASGVDASTGEAAAMAVRADATVSFHAPKLGHWISPGKRCTGELNVVPIGIPEGAPGERTAGLIRPEVLRLAPGRDARSTKFTSGEVLVVGGSRGLTGAVCLAAEAAIRAGAGYATVAVPADLEAIFEVKLTEVMSRGFGAAEGRLGAGDAGAIAEVAASAAAVVLGPGMGRDGATLALARALAERVEAPLLVDADGLAAYAGDPDALAGRAGPTVLTPHEGELARMLGLESADVAARRLDSVREAAARSGAVVVLKGDDTLVAHGNQLAISRGGAPALATAGTGDVLSGTVGALLARGMGAFEAACAGVEAHQCAGRIAAQRIGSAESVIAGDVVEALPEALS